MRRREFVKGIGAAGGLAALPWQGLLAEAAHAQAQPGAAPAPDAMGPESRKAFAELLALVAEAERRTLSAEWNVRSPQEVIDGHRVLLHLLAASIDLYYEGDPERPYWVQMPSPIRKYLGDNPDAHYFFTPLRGDRRYRIRGNTAGAVYTSFTFQGAETGAAAGITAARNHTQFDVAEDGSYELRDRAGRVRPERRAARREDGLDHHASLLRERDLGAARSTRAHSALDRAGGCGRAAAAAQRRRERAPHPRRRALLPREHARHAAARPEVAAGLGVHRAEPAREAGACRAGARTSRPGTPWTTPTAWARTC